MPGYEKISTAYRRLSALCGKYRASEEPCPLVEAYALLKKQTTCQFPLILAGGAGWKNDGVHKRIEDMALADAIGRWICAG